MNRFARLATLTGLIASSCGLPPMISDTGYKGTWHRGNDRHVSIVAITQIDGRWFFRWSKRSFDGKLAIRCDWEGRCEERLNGALVATYAITPRFEPASGRLFTDTVEVRKVPEERTVRYADLLEVADHGMTLRNFTVDRDGRSFEGGERPMRSFEKVADGVAEPPRTLAK